ncbi:hypothetical protein [Novosphingobium sp. Gsoil 351]|uniref:hypothetical protein n=1 Tax=Novosphingobium sp. Gsoil 351 TaxID=2675225 RepID=UPI00351B90A8
MRPSRTPPAALPRDLPTLAVLGLSNPAEGDWGRLRGLQYASLVKVGMVRLAVHMIAALIIALTYFAVIQPWFLGGWVAALAAVLYYGARFDRSVGDADRRRMSREEINQHTVSSVIAALVWIIPIVFFAPKGTELDRLTLWTVLAMLMTGSAVAFAAVPLGVLVFSGIVGGAAIASFALTGDYLVAVMGGLTWLSSCWVPSSRRAIF